MKTRLQDSWLIRHTSSTYRVQALGPTEIQPLSRGQTNEWGR